MTLKGARNYPCLRLNWPMWRRLIVPNRAPLSHSLQSLYLNHLTDKDNSCYDCS